MRAVLPRFRTELSSDRRQVAAVVLVEQRELEYIGHHSSVTIRYGKVP